MSTKIEWTDLTWNPITGCTPVSESCLNYYAKRMAARLAGRCGYPADDPFRVTFHPDKLDIPRKWKKPRRIFVCSMGDLFHSAISAVHICDILDICAQNGNHTFLLLTKRPERMRRLSNARLRYPQNVWCGATAENQARLDERVPHLLETPAKVLFLSLEPLLGPVNLSQWLDRLSWIIIGAETGPGKRPMNLDWARSVRDQCAEAGIPFFFKKDSNGRSTLDGVEHHEFPA